MTDNRCGCCEGTEALTPASAYNRPGLSAIRYRVGTHSTLLETMLARLTSHRLADGTRPLLGLTTRAPDDPAIALLDAWATVADVLTFYQERLANEGYLLTATERRSVLELARLVGYRLRPGVAASVFLAFTLDRDYRIEVPAGTRGQSIPGPGEEPQFFETADPLPARYEWNAIPARLTRPVFLRPQAEFVGTRALPLVGAGTNLKPADTVLFVCGQATQPYRVQTVLADAAANRTLVTYVPFGGYVAPAPPTANTVTPPEGAMMLAPSTGFSVSTAGDEAATTPALARLGDVVTALRKEPSQPPHHAAHLQRAAGDTLNAAADLAPRLLTAFDPRLADTLYTAYAQAPVTGSSHPECGVEALRVKAALYGATAPQELLFDNRGVPAGRREWAQVEFGATATVRFTSTDLQRPIPEAFGGYYGLTNQEGTMDANPLLIQVTLDNGHGGTRYSGTWNVRGMVHPGQPPHGSNDPVFTETRSLPGGGTVQVSVPYASGFGEFGYDDAHLRYVEVVFRLWPGHDTSIRVTPQNPDIGFNSTGSGPSDLDVSVDGEPPREAMRNQTLTDTRGSRTVTIALNGALEVTMRSPELATEEQLRTVSLDTVYEGITPGGWAVVERPGAAPTVAVVEQVRTVSRADYGVSARVTQLVLDRPWLGDPATSPALEPTTTLGSLRAVTVHARNEALELAEEIIPGDVSGSVLELDGLYDGLEAGRWLMVKGIRADVPGVSGEDGEGVEASELVMLAGVTHDVLAATDEEGQVVTDDAGNVLELPGDTLHTRLTLSTPLAYAYRRDSVRVNANVARATQGHTRTEVMGSGDGRVAFQQFTLRQNPLTWLAAPTPSGVESTLEVRVDGVRWPEHDTLLYLAPYERGYATRTDDEGKTTVVFGDGKRGARLPTGIENVSAVYRSGIGSGGNVGAGRISVLATRPLGVREVINPQRASGGADAETRDQARRNVPLAVLALDRLVSVQDYADFTRLFAGIGKAAAASISDGRRQVVHLTIAGVNDIPIDPAGDLYRNLLLALGKFGDPNLALEVDVREAVFLFVTARAKVLADHLWVNVEPRVRAALLDTFSFEHRELGQDVMLGEVIGAIQAVEGVDYVDVELLDGVSESDAADPAELAEKLEAMAAAVGGGQSPGCAPGRPRQNVSVQMARLVPSSTDPVAGIRPAQVAYLNPALPDTLVLTEVTA